MLSELTLSSCTVPCARLTRGQARLGSLGWACSAGLGVAGRKRPEWVLRVGCGCGGGGRSGVRTSSRPDGADGG